MSYDTHILDEFKRLPIFTLPDIRSDKWQHNYQMVRGFQKREGRLPSHHSKDNVERPLGRWCARQREDRRAGVLSPERQSLLLDIPGWRWDSVYEDWEKRLGDVEEFVRSKLRLPHMNRDDEFERSLSVWYYKQRSLRRRGMLSKEHSEKLEVLLKKWVKDWE